MKKIISVLAALLISATAAGCDILSDADIATDSSSISENNENSDAEENQEQQENDEESKAEEKTSSEESKDEDDKSEEEKDEVKTEDIEKIAVEQFNKSCITTWEYFMSCPYELDYSDMTENGAVRVMGVDCISDLIAGYSAVFTGDCSELSEKYVETDNALYCYDGARGENIYYQSTDLELVTADEKRAEFNAVSHFADPETGEVMEDETNKFVIVYDSEAQCWKTEEFTLPY